MVLFVDDYWRTMNSLFMIIAALTQLKFSFQFLVGCVCFQFLVGCVCLQLNLEEAENEETHTTIR